MFRRIIYTLFTAVLLAILAQGVLSWRPMKLGSFMLAQIGVSISTPANPYNTAARQLKEKEQSLTDREESIHAQEALLSERLKEEARTMRYLLAIASVLLGLILVYY